MLLYCCFVASCFQEISSNSPSPISNLASCNITASSVSSSILFPPAPIRLCNHCSGVVSAPVAPCRLSPSSCRGGSGGRITARFQQRFERNFARASRHHCRFALSIDVNHLFLIAKGSIDWRICMLAVLKYHKVRRSLMPSFLLTCLLSSL